MNSEQHFSSSTGLNEINPDCGSVIDELTSIVEDTSEYSGCGGGNTKVSSDALPVEPIDNKTTIIDNVRKSGEENIQEILIKTEIKLENTDFEADNHTVTDKNLEDVCVEEKKPNILIKYDSEECDIKSLNFDVIPTLTNTDRDRGSCNENKPQDYVKDEAITIHENYLEKDEAPESIDGKDAQRTSALNSTSTNKASNELCCALCSKIFKSKSNLKQHNLVHTKNRPFRCALCTKTFKSERDLKTHGLVHTNERPYACALCSKRFKYKHTLANHEVVHTNERPFKCDLCEKSFKCSRNLTQHRAVHADKRQFICSVCGKGFKHKHKLVQHGLIHNNERPFVCERCNKSFRYQRSLRLHVLFVHATEQKKDLADHASDERPFVCALCNKGFKRRRALTVHQVTHTNDHPFGCERCGKFYKRKRDLLLHKRLHANETVEKHERIHNSPNASLPQTGLQEESSFENMNN